MGLQQGGEGDELGILELEALEGIRCGHYQDPSGCCAKNGLLGPRAEAERPARRVFQ